MIGGSPVMGDKQKVSKRKEKLGAIYLDVSANSRIYESWDDAF